jgi:hypothetical protein
MHALKAPALANVNVKSLQSSPVHLLLNIPRTFCLAYNTKSFTKNPTQKQQHINYLKMVTQVRSSEYNVENVSLSY